MKVVLDEGVPEGLSDYLPSHGVPSVRELGAKGTKNGQLLKPVESVSAEAFITGDESIGKQQVLAGRPFRTLLLSTNSWPLIQQHTAAIASALDEAKPGEVTLSVLRCVHSMAFQKARRINALSEVEQNQELDSDKSPQA